MAVLTTFGEVMLRLSPPGKELLFQSPRLDTFFGGSEANVAVSLALFGHQSRYVSVVPPNEIGEAAVRELKKWRVDTSFILRQGHRLGIYFAEPGANQRASKVIYDRAGSAISAARADAFDWNRILDGVTWFHTTGITPALSDAAADAVLEAVKAARSKKVTVSVDLNFRAKLWTSGRKAVDVMPGIVQYADLLIGNEDDCQNSLGIAAAPGATSGALNPEDYEGLTDQVMRQFPNLTRVAISLRQSFSADHNGWSAVMRNRGKFIPGPSYDIRNIVDRIGAGDAFAAGLIHGLLTLPTDEAALAFAVAASCLKHAILGDFNLTAEKDVKVLQEGDRSGRVRR